MFNELTELEIMELQDRQNELLNDLDYEQDPFIQNQILSELDEIKEKLDWLC